MTAALAIAAVPRALHAQPRVELVVRPAGADAERLEARVAELVQQAGAQPELRHDDTAPEAAAEHPLARVSLEINRANRRLTVAIATESDALVRDIALPNGVLDETALEEAAQIVASSVNALLAGAALPKPEPETAPASEPSYARAVVPSEQAPTSREPDDPPPPETPRAPDHPAVEPARAASARTPAPPLTDDEPPAEKRDDTTTPADDDGTFAASLGYAVELFGPDNWLHGPQLVLAYATRFTYGAIGARLDGWLATGPRLQAQLIDAETSAQALRLFALYEPWPAALIGLELGAGVGVRATKVEGVDASEGTQPAESSLTSWAAEVYCGARLRSGLLLATLGLGFEFDPVAVDYGLQFRDRFVKTHASSHVRPSFQARVGLAF